LFSAKHHRNQIYLQAGMNCGKATSMLFLTRWFGVTGSDAERDRAQEQTVIKEIIERSLLLQSKTAAEQHRPIGRGTHVKGVCVRAQFEVFDVTAGRDPGLAARLARGMFARPGVYPATVRFANADPNKNSDFKADVRSLSFSVELTRGATDERWSAGFLNAKRDNSTNKRRTCIFGDDKDTYGNEPSREHVVLAVQGQIESVEDTLVGEIAVATDNQTVSASALLEHRTFSSRTTRYHQIFGYAVAG
jgi:hypothetical protein